MKDEKKSLVVSNESFWGKIKNFFANLLGKKEKVDSSKNVEATEVFENINNQVTQKETSFERFQRESENRNKVLKLRKEFESGNKHAEDMTDEEYDSLRNMYDDEIEKKLMTMHKKMKNMQEA